MSQILSNKKKLSDLQEFYIWYRHLTTHVKHRYITKSMCVLFHCKFNFSLKISVNFRKNFWMSYFNMNFLQGSCVYRTLFKNEMKGIKTGASSIYI